MTTPTTPFDPSVPTGPASVDLGPDEPTTAAVSQGRLVSGGSFAIAVP